MFMIKNLNPKYNPTFKAEITFEMINWCEQNLKGMFVIHSPDHAEFEREDDRDAFLKQYGSRVTPYPVQQSPRPAAIE